MSTVGTLEPSFRAVIRQDFMEEGRIKLSDVYLQSVVSTVGTLEPSFRAVIRQVFMEEGRIKLSDVYL